MNAFVNIFWFRRDLRLTDNAGLFQALETGLPLLPLFIFDRNILDPLEDKKDARVEFIYKALLAMQKQLTAWQSTLECFYGKPQEVFTTLIENYRIGTVFTNEDYEPYARERDAEVESLLRKRGIGFQSFKDQVIFSKEDVLKDDGSPYTVFTPYSKKWKSLLETEEEESLRIFATEKLIKYFFRQEERKLPELDSMGFYPSREKISVACS